MTRAVASQRVPEGMTLMYHAQEKIVNVPASEVTGGRGGAYPAARKSGRLGQLSPVPVKTRYGIHVVRVDKRVPGRALPCEAVAEKIADYLKEASWRRAFRQYVQLLAGSARISGIDMAAATTPLAL